MACPWRRAIGNANLSPTLLKRSAFISRRELRLFTSVGRCGRLVLDANDSPFRYHVTIRHGKS